MDEDEFRAEFERRSRIRYRAASRLSETELLACVAGEDRLLGNVLRGEDGFVVWASLESVGGSASYAPLLEIATNPRVPDMVRCHCAQSLVRIAGIKEDWLRNGLVRGPDDVRERALNEVGARLNIDPASIHHPPLTWFERLRGVGRKIGARIGGILRN